MTSPPLFDRLADTPDAAVSGARGGPAGARQALVESVARELQQLLNSHGSLAPAELERFPELRDSVLNYGMIPLTGVAASAVNIGAVAERIRASIEAFEPRLREVRVLADPFDPERPDLRFRIRGVLPLGEGEPPVVLETQVGLGTGDVRVAAGG